MNRLNNPTQLIKKIFDILSDKDKRLPKHFKIIEDLISTEGFNIDEPLNDVKMSAFALVCSEINSCGYK